MIASSALHVSSTLLELRMEQAGESTLPLRALTAGLARGDDAAWAEFHRAYGPGLFRLLLAATRGDYDLATEALQQTYLRIARHARPCEVMAVFETWLRVVARTALSDCRRRRRSFWHLLRRRHEDPSDVPSDECVAADDGRVDRALEVALAKLDPADRALLEQKYFCGLPVRTLAERLGISAKAAESRLTRARAELRRHLAGLFSSDE